MLDETLKHKVMADRQHKSFDRLEKKSPDTCSQTKVNFLKFQSSHEQVYQLLPQVARQVP